MKTVWVLTEEHNQYDQYGEYFLKVFATKPTEKQVQAFLIEKKELATYHIGSEYEEQFVAHILDGGGRKNSEDVWYYLREEILE